MYVDPSGEKIFGASLRYSDGWQDDELFINNFFFRLGLSSQTTVSEGESGIINAFAGATTDQMNVLETEWYAGIGWDISIMSYELQVETVGLSIGFSIGKLDVGLSANITGEIGGHIGITESFENNTEVTNAIVAGGNFGTVTFLVASAVYFASTGDLSMLADWLTKVTSTPSPKPA